MKVIDAIKARHSIRKFLPKKIPENTIKEILDAGRLAPSGCNAQPTRFVLINSDELKEKCLSEKVFAQNWVCKSPAVIVFCGNPKELAQADKVLPYYWKKIIQKSDYAKHQESRLAIDLAISSAFCVLRATELGLGSCYVGLINREKAKKVLGIPADYVIPFALVLGYPDEKPGRHDRKQLKEFILKKE